MSIVRVQQVPLPQPVPGAPPGQPQPEEPGSPAPVEDPPTEVPPPRQDPDVVDPTPSPTLPPMIADAAIARRRKIDAGTSAVRWR